MNTSSEIKNALSFVSQIMSEDILPYFDSLSTNDPIISLQLSTIESKIDQILDFLNNIRPNYWGLYTVQNNLAVTANNQNIPFDRTMGGSIIANSDGTITLPANCDFIVEADFNGLFSATGWTVFQIYNADTGFVYITAHAISENYNYSVDIAELYTNIINVGETPIRIACRVATKQISGTLNLYEYQTTLKVTEV